MSASVTWVACTAVNRWLSAPTSSSSSVGVTPWAARQSVVLLRLLGDVGMERQPLLVRPRRDAPIDAGSTARTEWIAAPMRHVRVSSELGAVDPLRRTPTCRR